MRVNRPALSELRKARGLTLYSLAANAGVARSTLLRLEDGTSDGRPATLRLVADALGVPIEAITLPDQRGGAA